MTKLRTLFVKTAKGELQPNNFGNAIVSAVNDGDLGKQWVASLLGVEEGHIRKAANGLKGRKLEQVSQAIVNAYSQVSI